MNYLIIGGQGLIGVNLAQALEKRGNKVYCSTVDIIKNKIPVSAKWDYVFYLAGIPEPNTWGEKAIEVLQVSSTGLESAIKTALRSRCPLLYTSSSAVYGKAPIPMGEKSSSLLEVWSPRERYAIGKAYGEALCLAYGERKGLEYRIVRPFNVYGPYSRKDDSRIIPNMIRRALEGRTLQVTGDGTQTRCFCYIDDFIQGVLSVMLCAPKTVANIGNPDQVTIKQVTDIIAKLTGASVENIDRPAGDITDRVPDISLLQSFGWNPQVRLEDGIRRTLEWARENWM